MQPSYTTYSQLNLKSQKHNNNNQININYVFKVKRQCIHICNYMKCKE